MSKTTVESKALLSFEQQFNIYVQSGFPLIGIRTREVDRATGELRRLTDKLNTSLQNTTLPADKEHLKKRGFRFFTWEAVNGWTPYGAGPIAGTGKTPEAGLIWFNTREEAVPGVYIMQNTHMFDVVTHQLPLRVGLFREAYNHGQKNNKHIFLVGDFEKLPKELEPYVVMIDFDLPEQDHIYDYLKKYTSSLGLQFQEKVLKDASRAATGMTMLEVESALCVSVVESKGRKINTDIIFEEKAKAVRKTGLLEHIPSVFNLERDAGGMGNLKEWATRVAKVFHQREKAEKYKLPNPKGCLLTGIAGTGKSLFAKAIANLLGVPLFRLDIGRIFGGVVGQTESQARQLTNLADALAPCVIWIDEIEKALSGLGSSDRSDSGVTSRLIGHLLTWMQEKSSMVYVVATANNVDALPPEMLRKGRFDEIWFVDLPGLAERQQIFDIHIRNKGRDMKKVFTPAKLRKLAQLAYGYTGAEIQEGIAQGMTHAFFEDREFTVEDVARAIQGTTPLRDIKPKEIEALRSWAKETKARLANVSSVDTEKPPAISKKKKDSGSMFWMEN